MATHVDLPSIFVAAQALPAGPERDAYLDDVCRGNPALRARAEVLLRALGPAGGFLGESTQDETVIRTHVPDAAEAAAMAEGVGAQIGPYRLLQQIGEGGMGAVFMAEQERPVRRRVALKVIKAGMDTGQVVARFEAERQALALMDHPSIARVLDAGATDRGRPYFVMELVKGIPITQYCDEARLTPRQRLELFLPVCSAIQHAHQKGIIHRDIKPSNVLVTLLDGSPLPKVIDFGVAKATEQKLTERTLFTQFGAIVGTPEYMSPEQADISALDVDTRADIYSLGVLLYELLTGSTPLDRESLRRAAFGEILRRIKEEEPPRPSQRLSSSGDRLAGLSAVRGVEPARLRKLVRGDVDWIVMKALEKDRSRRYETANGFARDVRRHLDGDAVEARPPSTTYRLGKFARKHRTGLIVASAFALLLVAATVVSATLAVVARRALVKSETARKEAEAARKESEATNGLLIDIFRRPDPKMDGATLKVVDLLGRAIDRVKSDPGLDRGAAGRLLATLGPLLDAYRRPDSAATRVVDLLKDAARRVDAAVVAPIARAKLLYALGLTYAGLGLQETARDLLKKALDIQSERLPPADPDRLATRVELIDPDVRFLKTPEDEFVRETIRHCEATFGPDDRRTILARCHLAEYLTRDYKTAESIPLAEETLRRAEARHGPGDEPVSRSRRILAFAYVNSRSDRREEAYRVAELNVDSLALTLGPDHVDTILALGQLAWLAERNDRMPEAIARREEILRRAERTLGPEHPWTIGMRETLALNYADTGRRGLGFKLLLEVLEQEWGVIGIDPDRIGQTIRSVSLNASTEGEGREAMRVLRALQGRPGHQPADASRGAAMLKQELELVTTWVARWGWAEEHYRATRPSLERLIGPDNRFLIERERRVALVYLKHGRHAEGFEMLREALGHEMRALGIDDQETWATAREMALHATTPEEAEEAARALMEIRGDRARPNGVALLLEKAELMTPWVGRSARVAEHHRATLALIERAVGPGDPWLVRQKRGEAMILLGLGQHAEGFAMLREALKHEMRTLGADDHETWVTAWGMGRYATTPDEAEEAAEAMAAIRSDRGTPHDVELLREKLKLMRSWAGRSARVAEHHRATLALIERAVGPGDPWVVEQKRGLPLALLELGRHAEGFEALRDALGRLEKTAGPLDQGTSELAKSLLMRVATAAQAEVAIREAEGVLAARLARFGDEDFEVFLLRQALGLIHTWAGHLGRAEELYAACLPHARRLSQSVDAPDWWPIELANTLGQLGRVHAFAGEPGRARALLDKAIDRSSRSPAARDLTYHLRLIRALVDLSAGRAAETIGELESILASMRAIPPPDRPDIHFATMILADCDFQLGRHAEADSLWRELIPRLRGRMVETFDRTGMRSRLGAIRMSQGRFAEAEPLILAGYRDMKRSEGLLYPIYRPRLAENARRVVELYRRWGKPAEAERRRIELGLPADLLPIEVFARP